MPFAGRDNPKSLFTACVCTQSWTGHVLQRWRRFAAALVSVESCWPAAVLSMVWTRISFDLQAMSSPWLGDQLGPSLTKWFGCGHPAAESKAGQMCSGGPLTSGSENESGTILFAAVTVPSVPHSLSSVCTPVFLNPKDVIVIQRHDLK